MAASDELRMATRGMTTKAAQLVVVVVVMAMALAMALAIVMAIVLAMASPPR